MYLHIGLFNKRKFYNTISYKPFPLYYILILTHLSILILTHLRKKAVGKHYG